MEQAKSLETAFEELDKIIVGMQDRDLSLEDSFKLYEKGIKLVRYCSSAIDRVEKKVIEIQGERENGSL